MSVASEITRLQNAKASLKTSIEGKGVTVPSSTKLDGYADLVDSIEQGGGSIEDLITKENLVRIIVGFGHYDFTLDASNNFNDESSDPSLLTTNIIYIKLIFADLELDYYPNMSYFSSDTTINFLVVSGVEFSLSYTQVGFEDCYITLYRNNEQIGHLKARRD